jgi:hypothetical protein
LDRLVRPDRDDLSPELARALLGLDFDKADRDRMHELVVKNQDGKLTADEPEMLDSYRRIGYLVDLLRSKARLILKEHRR